MECLHCNKTPMCIQVPGDLLTRTQHWQSAARVRCAWWWWHHHFWQLSPTSVEWGNVPKIKTDSRINNDRFFEPFLCVLNWCSISSITRCQKIIKTFSRHFSTPPVRVTGDTGECYWVSRLLQDGLVTCAHTDWLYFLLETGRSHGTRPVGIPTDMPTFSSGCTTGNNSQGCGCQQLSEIVPFPCRFTSISVGGRLHQSVYCSSLLRYLQLYTTTYLLVRIIKPRKPCPAQPWIFSDFK